MSVAIDIDNRLTEKEEIQEVAIPKESQSEANHGMTKVEGELQIFINKRLDMLPGVKPGDEFYDPIDARTIFRLPNHEMKNELCEPKAVSIGPYHRGKPSLQTMENQKWFTLRGFLKRPRNVGLEVYLDAMKFLVPRVRMCYSEPVDLKRDDFALMLLLDGCFILEWLFGVRDHNFPYNILSTGWNIRDIFHDLCLMENQVPFIVIHTLLTIQDQGVGWSPRCKSVGQSCPLVDLINNALKELNINHPYKFKPINPQSYPCSSIWHLLHLYYVEVTSEFASPKIERSRNCFPCFNCFACLRSKPASDSTQETPSDYDEPHNLFSSDCFPCSKLFPKLSKAASDHTQETRSDYGEPHNHFSSLCFPYSKLCPKLSKAASDGSLEYGNYINMTEIDIMCVSELCDAGVKFRKKKYPKHMLDISFENGILEMPFLKIDRDFVRRLWNLVAYEQKNLHCGHLLPLSNYLALMDSLIDTEKDVAILERAGIVNSYFSNAEEAAVFFNQFGKLFVLIDDKDLYFANLFQDIKKYSESTWNKYRAKMVQDYFSNPWAIISVVAAVVLFALTILQTYYSAMSV